ncbi:unnamed protein product, partial [Symbiodinium microadriaticum]
CCRCSRYSSRIGDPHVESWWRTSAILGAYFLAVELIANLLFYHKKLYFFDGETASSDEELAFKQKERDVAMYTRKVRKLFQTMDDSGDGALNLEEFAKLANSPKLAFWMSQLELEYHDLMSLFEFLDNGDGQITLTEFIEGAARLRGSAKAIDVWRLETKVEVLMGELLRLLHPEEELQVKEDSPVQKVFNQSIFSHIHSVTLERRQSVRDSPAEGEPTSPVVRNSV